jgi:hypothetical protein
MIVIASRGLIDRRAQMGWLTCIRYLRFICDGGYDSRLNSDWSAMQLFADSGGYDSGGLRFTCDWSAMGFVGTVAGVSSGVGGTVVGESDWPSEPSRLSC